MIFKFKPTLFIITLCVANILAVWVTSAHMAGLPLSATEKTAMLNAHNNARASVNPPAQFMNVLVWDDQLASIAQSWSEQCVSSNGLLLNHNPNRGVGYPTSVGENIYASTGAITSMSAVVNSWDSEKIYYNLDTNTCAAGKVCGHYTQVVWANTQKVGCGRSLCNNVTYKYSVVCNYGPAGNYIGQKPYQKVPSARRTSMVPTETLVAQD